MPEAAKKPGKQPSDHKPKAEAAEVEEAKPPADLPRTVDINGTPYQIDPDRFDLTYVELMEDEKYVLVLRHILGDEQWGKFKDQFRNEKGLIPQEAFEHFNMVFEGN